MLSLATVIFSACLDAISSRTGATILHGPHHSAQKSTSTGLSDVRTSLWKLVSVTVLVVAPTDAPRWSAMLRTSQQQYGGDCSACNQPPACASASSSCAASQRSAS